MTLNGVMAVTLHYFTDFGKPALQHITVLICGGIYARVYCILWCVYDVVVKNVHVRYLNLLVSFTRLPFLCMQCRLN